METQEHMQSVIQDLQLRKLEMGAQIVALKAEVQRLKNANADQQIVMQIKDRELDTLKASFDHAPLGKHVVAWLRSRW